MQVNKDGDIKNREELDFRQHSPDSTIELKTQRSLCYAAGQDPGVQHQPPLILQDFSPEYASIDPKCKTMAGKISDACLGYKKISGRTTFTMDPERKTTEYSGLRLRQACDRDVGTLAIDGSPIITI